VVEAVTVVTVWGYTVTVKVVCWKVLVLMLRRWMVLVMIIVVVVWG
jgi:hypothetical protein